MADCHAALVGAAAGAIGPLMSQAVGRVTGMCPEHLGSGQEIPPQPSGVIAGFGALTCSSAAAFVTLSSGSFLVGAGVGVATAILVTSVATGDMLQRAQLVNQGRFH
eukprot:TRINITY_DN100459_c0_g1_i1.p1 TRINITY_DN100459_c0_g1~~TRINITY_DN100459_c0_g1_i1.p1  ORF type:complete len:124 (-),score=19.36 TRINITY_DN100459_c0_g1_i1:72-392(-)